MKFFWFIISLVLLTLYGIVYILLQKYDLPPPSSCLRILLGPSYE